MQSRSATVRGPVADVGIGLHEPLGPALARIAAGRFDRITTGLRMNPDRDAAVHNSRKALKRLRALLRLIRKPLGKKAFREEDVVLRDLGRALAPVRDARVTIDTLDAIAPGECPDLRDRFVAHHRTVAAGLLTDPDRMAHIVTTTKCARERWTELLPGLIPDEFDSIRPGIARTYRRGRRRMAQALERNSDEAFHEWRKEVKYLRYQLEALRTIAPEGLGSRITVLTDLGEVLGFEHDLTVLTNLIEADRRCGVTAAGLPAVLRARKEGLRGSAASRAQRAYAEEVDDFVAPIDDAWATARRAGVPASPG